MAPVQLHSSSIRLRRAVLLERRLVVLGRVQPKFERLVEPGVGSRLAEVERLGCPKSELGLEVGLVVQTRLVHARSVAMGGIGVEERSRMGLVLAMMVVG